MNNLTDDDIKLIVEIPDEAANLPGAAAKYEKDRLKTKIDMLSGRLRKYTQVLEKLKGNCETLPADRKNALAGIIANRSSFEASMLLMSSMVADTTADQVAAEDDATSRSASKSKSSTAQPATALTEGNVHRIDSKNALTLNIDTGAEETDAPSASAGIITPAQYSAVPRNGVQNPMNMTG